MTLQDRFWSKVRKSEQCWIWQARVNDLGYGAFWVPRSAGGVPRGKVALAHRVCWEFSFGAIPSGLLICHRCDNPPCVRPDHLFLGTDLVNSQDKIEKGRSRHATGSENGRAKLDWEKVCEIRARYSDGGISQKSLAQEFGIARTQVSNIVLGRQWQFPSAAR